MAGWKLIVIPSTNELPSCLDLAEMYDEKYTFKDFYFKQSIISTNIANAMRRTMMTSLATFSVEELTLKKINGIVDLNDHLEKKIRYLTYSFAGGNQSVPQAYLNKYGIMVNVKMSFADLAMNSDKHGMCSINPYIISKFSSLAGLVRLDSFLEQESDDITDTGIETRNDEKKTFKIDKICYSPSVNDYEIYEHISKNIALVNCETVVANVYNCGDNYSNDIAIEFDMVVTCRDGGYHSKWDSSVAVSVSSVPSFKVNQSTFINAIKQKNITNVHQYLDSMASGIEYTCDYDAIKKKPHSQKDVSMAAASADIPDIEDFLEINVMKCTQCKRCVNEYSKYTGLEIEERNGDSLVRLHVETDGSITSDNLVLQSIAMLTNSITRVQENVQTFLTNK